MSSTSFIRRSWRRFTALLKNEYFWGGVGALLLLALGVYLLFNNVLMPTYTRHDVTVTVPDVRTRPFEEAAQQLRQRNLEVERVTAQNYNANVPRNAVVDQTPPPSVQVKPGRRIYLTVNSGTTPMVQIPEVEGMSLREGINRIRSVGLNVKDTRPDSIPSPYANTITRQTPAPGDSLKEGSSVTLWYSTGLGDTYVEVPDVTNLPVQAAQQRLYDKKLRSVVVGADSEEEAPPAVEEEEDSSAPADTVARQSREPGTRVRAGFEIRLYLKSDTTNQESPDL